MDNTMICYGCLSMAVFHPSRTISSLVIMWTVENSRWKQYACF